MLESGVSSTLKFIERKTESLSGPLISRHGQLDCPVIARFSDYSHSSHGLDHRPVLPKKCRSVLNIWPLHLDAASLSSAVVRYLKMERVACRLRVFVVRPAFAAHLVSPLALTA